MTQEEIKAAMERVIRVNNGESKKTVYGDLKKVKIRRSCLKIWSGDADVQPAYNDDVCTLSDAYIDEYDDTPITLDEATELCKGSKYVMAATFTGSDIFAEIGTKDMTDYFHVEIKSRNQLLALLKGLGE